MLVAQEKVRLSRKAKVEACGDVRRSDTSCVDSNYWNSNMYTIREIRRSK